jgi:1-acyl-sn-glycerol-3-phosphate acyltransferase
MARWSGHVRACREEAKSQLRAGELVGVFPEGFKGIGKPFSQRYQLQRFGRGGFASLAREAGAPIIPCAIVGAEEIYPMIGNLPHLARLLRLPYFPVTPLFPWLGLVGAVPLPSNWIIEFCPLVPTDTVSTNGAGPDKADSCLADTVRDMIQCKLDELVAERGPAFS